MAIGIGMGSAFMEDWEEEQKKFEDDSMAISPAMKEDLKAEQEKFKDDSMAISPAMKEDLKRCRKGK
jgi:hypothetical protein